MKGECKEVNIRFIVSEETHNKVQKLQAMFRVRENRKISIKETYVRLIDRGLLELNKTMRL